MNNGREKLTYLRANQLIEGNTQEFVSPEIMKNPLLSVVVLTFQQTSFIEQALASVIGQVTDFPFEIIICDDHSKDGSFDKIKRFWEENPEKVRILSSTSNLGIYTGNGRLNLVRGFSACRGKYIALLEGDDFWKGEEKLQQQVDLLERDSSLSAVIHRAEIVDESGSLIDHVPREEVEELTRFNVNDTLLHSISFAHTASAVFRKPNSDLIPEWALSAYAADRVIYTCLAAKGDIGYLNKIFSVYRKHPEGISSKIGNPGILQFRLLFFRNIYQEIGREKETEVRRGQQLGFFYHRLLLASSEEGSRFQQMKLIGSILGEPFRSRFTWPATRMFFKTIRKKMRQEREKRGK